MVAMRRMTASCRSLGQAGDDVGRLRRRQVREDQGDRLRMLVDDEGQQVLAVDLLQEAERQGLDRLADVVERGRWRSCPGPARPGSWPRPDRRSPPVRAVRIGVGELLDDLLLLFAADRAEAAISIETASTWLGVELADQVGGLLPGQAHQKHSGFADIGPRGHGSCSEGEPPPAQGEGGK